MVSLTPHGFSFLPPQPESYLELITAFKTSLAAKRDEISAAKKRYEVGLEKLAFATESVNAMQVREPALELKQPLASC